MVSSAYEKEKARPCSCSQCLERKYAWEKLVDPNRNFWSRREEITQMGASAFMALALSVGAAQQVAADDRGVLWRVLINKETEEYRAVEVIDPANQEHIFIRVPPTIQTPHSGIAWSFRRTPRRYAPTIET